MIFLLCDAGWYVHKPMTSNINKMTTQTHSVSLTSTPMYSSSTSTGEILLEIVHGESVKVQSTHTCSEKQYRIDESSSAARVTAQKYLINTKQGKGCTQCSSCTTPAYSMYVFYEHHASGAFLLFSGHTLPFF